MSASGSEIFAVLGRIHVLLRRDLNRITDIEWASVNKAYASEVVRLCSTASHPDLQMLAAKLSDMLELTPTRLSSSGRAPAPMGPTTQAALADVVSTVRGNTESRYRGGLR